MLIPVEDEDQIFYQQVIEFIRDANLNKTTASSLLSLLRSSTSCGNMPSSLDELLKRLNISFHYDVFTYCSNYSSPLETLQDICGACDNLNRKPNSELIVFTLLGELQRVIRSNIKLIQWYSYPENQYESDVVNGYLSNLN